MRIFLKRPTYVFNFKTVKKKSQKGLDNNIRKFAKFKRIT